MANDKQTEYVFTDGESVTFERGLMRVTDYGLRFARAVGVRSSEDRYIA